MAPGARKAKKNENEKDRTVQKEGKGGSEGKMDIDGGEAPPRASTAGRENKVAAAQKLLEFYFGDSNLRADGFLQHERKKNAEGWVAFDVLKTFKKLSAATDGDVEVMREGARGSSELAVSDDGEWVRRIKELPLMDDSANRTVYVEGIGETTQVEDVEKALGVCGKILYVRIPRIAVTESRVSDTGQHEPQHVVRKSKGYCFVEFSAAEDASKAVESGESRGLMLEGRALIVMAKQAWEKSKQEFQKHQKSERPVDGEERGQRAHGAMVRFEGGRGPLTRLGIREAFEAFAPVANIDLTDFKEGEEATGYVRFENPRGARLCVRHMQDRGQRLGGAKISVAILSIEEEKDYIASCSASVGKAWAGPDANTTADPKGGDLSFVAGVLVSFRTKHDTPSTVDYRSLRKAISAVDKVEFLEYDASSHSGCARMSSASGALKVCGALGLFKEGKGPAPDQRETQSAMAHIESWQLLEGDEEREYWSKVQAAKVARTQGAQQGHGKQHKTQAKDAAQGQEGSADFKGSHTKFDDNGEDGASGEGKKRGREREALGNGDGHDGGAKRHKV